MKNIMKKVSYGFGVLFLFLFVVGIFAGDRDEVQTPSDVKGEAQPAVSEQKAEEPKETPEEKAAREAAEKAEAEAKAKAEEEARLEAEAKAKAEAEAKAKAAKEEEAARKEEAAARKANAAPIDYAQLKKNPDRYEGEYVKYTGEIVQIMEGDNLTHIRLAVEEDAYGYDFNSIVFVEYDGYTDFVDEDIVTVHGEIYGSYSYESQAGYNITLPGMIAETIE